MNSPQNFETQIVAPAPTDEQAPLCEQHGIAMERWVGAGVPRWVCARCADEQTEAAAAAANRRHDQERAQAAQQRRQKELEDRFARACLPPRYRDVSFDTFPGTSERAKAHCSTLRSYANRWRAMREQGISVLLVGGAGTGKSGLACSVANVVIRDHAGTAMFITALGAVRHQRDTWGRRGRTESDALKDLVLPDLLIVDEVGSSVGSDTETAMLFEVFNERYQARRPTMALSNLPMDDFIDGAGAKRPGLRTYLGTRILDRFRDDGGFVLAFDWPSLRGARA